MGKSSFSLLVFFALTNTAMAVGTYTCAFSMEGAPFVTTFLVVQPDGRLANPARVDHYGSVRDTGIEEQTPQTGELFRFRLDTEYPGSEVFQVIYAAVDANGDNESVLVNPASPLMKELKSTCRFNRARD